MHYSFPKPVLKNKSRKHKMLNTVGFHNCATHCAHVLTHRGDNSYICYAKSL